MPIIETYYRQQNVKGSFFNLEIYSEFIAFEKCAIFFNTAFSVTKIGRYGRSKEKQLRFLSPIHFGEKKVNRQK